MVIIECCRFVLSLLNALENRNSFFVHNKRKSPCVNNFMNMNGQGTSGFK